eukprot:2716746-Rhodomonas_salina.2
MSRCEVQTELVKIPGRMRVNRVTSKLIVCRYKCTGSTGSNRHLRTRVSRNSHRVPGYPGPGTRVCITTRVFQSVVNLVFGGLEQCQGTGNARQYRGMCRSKFHFRFQLPFISGFNFHLELRNSRRKFKPEMKLSAPRQFPKVPGWHSESEVPFTDLPGVPGYPGSTGKLAEVLLNDPDLGVRREA